MYGWNGKVLKVNLTNSKVTIEDLNAEWARDYIGSRGLGAKYLLEEIDPKVDAYSPDNKLIFATGPLTGTLAAAGGRYMVVTKSPLTGGLTNSNSGGFFPAELKYTGFDLVIFEGKAEKPVYVWINNSKVEIRDASELWGKNTIETEDIIKSQTDENAKVACIGPAGENLVRFACIINDKGRAAGRTGVGAVMGSKNLKAVAVRGTKGVVVADKTGFTNACMDVLKFLDNEYVQEFHEYGTPGVLSLINEKGVHPTRNFQQGVFEGAAKLQGDVLAKTLSKIGNKGRACFACPVACGRVSVVSNPDFAGEGEGPEYETIGAFGSACGNDNLEAVTKANFICNEMGMDTISAGMTIACAMELYEKGYLPKEDVGMELNFGNAKAIVELTKIMANREGFGNILAEGSYRMAEKYGHPELSMSSKKQEYPCYDARGLQGLAIQYATQTRGGDHIRGETHDIDLYGVYDWNITKKKNITYVDPYDTEGKPLMAKEVQDWFACFDSTGMCNFIFFLGVNEDMLLSMLDTATGANYGTVEEMIKAGERVFNLERLFNLKAGLTSKDDTIPPRMLQEPSPVGPAKGQVAYLDKMLPKYYNLRGWDSMGVPTMEKLKELGIE